MNENNNENNNDDFDDYEEENDDDENDNKNETSNNVEIYTLTITGELTVDNKNSTISTSFNKMDMTNIRYTGSAPLTYGFTQYGIEFKADETNKKKDPLSEKLKTYTVNFGDISEFKIEEKAEWEETRNIEHATTEQLKKAAYELYVKTGKELQMPDAKNLLSRNPNFKKIVEKAQKNAFSDDKIDAKAVTKMSPEEYLVFLTLKPDNKDKFITYKKSWIPNPFSSLKPAAAKSFNVTRRLASLAGVRGGRKKTRKIRKYKKKNSCL